MEAKKTFKRFILFFFFTTTAITSFAQARVDKTGTYRIIKATPIVSNIVGWQFDDVYGKWAGYKNLIEGTYKRGNNKVPIVASIEDMGENVDNILSLQFKLVNINGETYRLMYLTRWRHWYDYPSIYEGRHNYKHIYIYLFPETEYRKLFSLEIGDITHVHYVDTNDYGADGNTLGTLYKSERQMFMAWASDGNKDYSSTQFTENMCFEVKKEDAKTIRFQYPNTVGLSDFSTRYFEMSIANWNLLNLK